MNDVIGRKYDWSYSDCRISWWWCPGRCSAERRGPSGPASSQRWPLDPGETFFFFLFFKCDHNPSARCCNPNSKFTPPPRSSESERRRLLAGSPKESEDWRELGRGGSALYARSRSPASSVQVERRYLLSVPRWRTVGGGVICLSWSHTRWSSAHASSFTTVRSCEADRASVAGAIVLGAGAARYLSASHPTSSRCVRSGVCATVEEEEQEEEEEEWGCSK